MAESIAEAEAEIKAHKNGANVVTESLIRAEEAQESKDDLSALDSTSAKSIKQMTDDLIDGALTTKSVVSYNGGEVDVKNFSDDGSEEIRQNTKAAIKQALYEVDPNAAKKAALAQQAPL
jgi:hypothetical protein